ncbi:FdhF/YdeP family oxidoreductase [Acidovorax sp. SUPP2825]|uniref:FdhF/YdeP family oxidoreductase n=1 Tax=Acidovorax sp. SUPP2825 TaxID=2920879 RepID=UPI0023DE5215|nr:FdhF/YdeP family oxidoreductase [Acidovorax sp. SUPP2825]GKS97535.1 FdhF/YdeP family oxidoreductase [Acidovorax sp. SUPP2825]
MRDKPPPSTEALATPASSASPDVEHDPPSSGGWGSVRAVAGTLLRDRPGVTVIKALALQNKHDGFTCSSCAWAKPLHPHPAEFCENGAKATSWELTDRRLDAAFFDSHPLAELAGWTDHALEAGGRLTVPLRYDAGRDRYVEVSWQEAFDGIGRELKALQPDAVVFYASGRASLETSYLWQLFARLYGTNNLPDSSNMCHESTSVGLKKSIGSPVGTVDLDDFDQCDAIFFFGQNVGVSSPRMLHPLQDARRRGVPIVTFNPLRESGLVAFNNPQSPVDMLTPGSTAISTQYLQVRPGGDIAALTGLCKFVIEADDAALASGGPRAIDAGFVAEHTQGYDELAQAMRAASWADIESDSGLSRSALEEAARTYLAAERVIGIYGMGLTQHREGVLNVQMLANLLLLRGNVGKPGAGLCPVRGHSNVQGQRTVGITEKPELAPLDQLASQFQFEPPRKKGLDTVAACRGILDGSVRAFLGLGGNFVRAVPETALIEGAWRRMRLTVQIATKLNRSHVMHGEVAYLLPCLGRVEIDRQAGGEQTVSTEDSTGFMHPSRGVAEPAAATLRSELSIVAGIAQATLAPNACVPWAGWTDDYARVRDAIALTFPRIFHDFNRRLAVPGGFARPIAARHRVWETDSGRAAFVAPGGLQADPDQVPTPVDGEVLRLFTIRSDDQFNTTIYSLNDRFRRIEGTRQVLLMNAHDIERLGLQAGARVTARTQWRQDDVRREVSGLTVVAYDLPRGAVAGYYPELNPLMPLDHHARESHVPAAKSIPVRLFPG